MQSAVERDSENHSKYNMCAVSPSRISPSFSDEVLCEVAVAIATLATSLLEIANYKVEGQRCICAGELIPSKP
ncbi:hypothetical protein K443DRAFT_12328 [Laccaria amethystina LaAM-08-1]|uniref:Unplaced genomic scaffold K443scaffold_270, whole genome shotgun sequence n=1 Tax=Laccaria amethystina LaAM-08-1 TaxID=1095629 RepID=A0A0C9WYY4_9AGAR|nr:hypothetical protein K443DRAFT_12328 [Laccaria amethystina LaAM-08-1]